MHNFVKDLAKGKAGEDDFYNLHNNKVKLTKIDGFKGDFIKNNTKEKIELKSDNYSLYYKGGNSMIERYSNSETKSPGGPWQAQSHNCTFFVYYYLQERVAFWYETNSLIDYIEKNKLMENTGFSYNKGYRTMWAKISRTKLRPVCLYVQTNDKISQASKSIYDKYYL